MGKQNAPSPNLMIVEGDEEAGAYIKLRLWQYSMSQVRYDRERVIESVYLMLKDPDKQIMGGLVAYIDTYWRSCHINILWIEEQYRNLGYGSQLLRKLEEIVQKRKCGLITLNTASFYAPEFYAKHEYELCGAINNYPPGHSLYYFKKTITSK